MTSNPPRTTVGRSLGRQHTSVVRERQAGYDLDGAGFDGGRSGDGGGSTTGHAGALSVSPVLVEVPALAGPLEAVVVADRSLIVMVLGLVRLLEADRDVAVETTGVGVEHWLALTTGWPRLERRTWLRAARLLTRLPQLHAQVEAGVVSGGQLRALTVALRGVPAVIDSELDRWLADAAAELSRLQAEPDALIDQARQAVIELTDQVEVLEHDADRTRTLHLQPRLDGSGGTFTGDEDAYGFAILEAATRPRTDQHHLDDGRARADNLLQLLHHLPPDTNNTGQGEEDDGGEGGDDGGEGGPVVHRSWGHALTDADQQQTAWRRQLDELPGLAERIASYAEHGGRTPPKLLVRAELSTLIDGRIPATLLTRLAGGQLHLTATAARALTDHHGTELRLTIIDHGQVVGIGRASRRPPGWLTDTLHTLHHHCTSPLCNRPAHSADIDHTAPWHPHDHHTPAGRTDLDNLGPLCAHHNRNRPATGWHPHQHHTNGTRTWTHPRTGLTTTTIPTTWRPPPHHHNHPTRPPDSRPPDTEPPHTEPPDTEPPDTEPPDTRRTADPDDLPF